MNEAKGRRERGSSANHPGASVKIGWQITTLDKISVNLDSQRVPITKAARTSGAYPYYGASGIVDYVADYIFEDDTLLVSEDGANLLARSSPIAFSATGKYWVNNHAHILKFDDRATQQFVEYYLDSVKLDDYVTGMAQPKLTQKALNSIPIPLPPLPEQRRIVGILDQAFAGIATAKANAEKNLKNARGLFESHLEGIFARRGEGWVEKRLDQACEIIMGTSPDGASYNTQGAGVPLINGPVEFSADAFGKTVRSKFTTEPNKLCKENDLILCVRGSTTGRMNIAGFAACIGRGVAAIRARVYQPWINHFIYSRRNEIYRLGTGATFPNITAPVLAGLKLSVPGMERQQEIVATFGALRKETQRIESLNQRKLAALDELKKSLVHQAFSGEL